METKRINGKDFNVLTLQDVLTAKRLGREVVIEDWPYGRSKRCIMKFSVEIKGKYERMVKQSIFNGRANKPKKETYAKKVFFIEIDGKIGRVEFAKDFPFVNVYMEDSSFVGVNFHNADYDVLVSEFEEKKSEINWPEFYHMSKSRNGYSLKEYGKKYGYLLERPHIVDALEKAGSYPNFLKMIQPFEKV